MFRQIVESARIALRGQLQEYEERSGRRRYAAQAARLGLAESSTVEAIRAALAQRLKSRTLERGPKGAGKLRIFLACAVRNWEVVLPNTLSKFGLVKLFDWHALGYDEFGSNWLRDRDAMNAAMLTCFEEFHREAPVDVVIGYLSGHNTSRSTIERMVERGAVVLNFCFDDKLHFPGRIVGGRFDTVAEIAPAVDLNLTNSPDSIIKYNVHGGIAMFWPEAADPEIHKPSGGQFIYDVSFVGKRYGRRSEFIRRLQQAGISVKCFGIGWDGGELPLEDVVRVFSQSRINLGFGGIGCSWNLCCLKGRDFEVPMAGGLYLTQDHEDLGLVYLREHEVVVFRDVTECIDKIQFLLSNPESAAAIREAGHRRSLRDHTYTARWTNVFELTGLVSARGEAS